MRLRMLICLMAPLASAWGCRSRLIYVSCKLRYGPDGHEVGIMNSRNHYMLQWYINILHHVHIIKHC